jgi:hypothetical protein
MRGHRRRVVRISSIEIVSACSTALKNVTVSGVIRLLLHKHPIRGPPCTASTLYLGVRTTRSARRRQKTETRVTSPAKVSVSNSIQWACWPRLCAHAAGASATADRLHTTHPPNQGASATQPHTRMCPLPAPRSATSAPADQWDPPAAAKGLMIACNGGRAPLREFPTCLTEALPVVAAAGLQPQGDCSNAAPCSASRVCCHRRLMWACC